MNADERRYTSTLLRLLACTLPLTVPAAAAQLVIVDPNCVQPIYDPNLVPFAIEPNAIEGYLLPPVPGDPNTWRLPAGKWQRLAAKACDDEGDPFTIEYMGGTSPATVHHDPAAGTWAVAAEILVGPNLWRFRAVDDPGTTAEPESATFTIVVEGQPRPNTPPVLE